MNSAECQCVSYAECCGVSLLYVTVTVVGILRLAARNDILLRRIEYEC